jgi:hypothetical protein
MQLSAWTQALVLMMNREATLEDLVKALKSDRCATEINVGNVNGAVFKACPTSELYCSTCPSGWAVVKVSKSAASKKDSGAVVTDQEALITKQIHDAMRSLAGKPAAVYADHVVTYIKHYIDTSKEPFKEAAIVTKLVPFNPRGPRNMREYVASGSCSSDDFCSLVVQVFMTLAMVRKMVPGFVHMDLTMSQVFLQPWPLKRAHYLLPARSGDWLIRQTKYWPVIGDFGTSITDAHPEAYALYGLDAFGPECRSTAQDIFRFFADADDAASGTRLKPFIQKIVSQLFNGKFKTLKAMGAKGTLYLPNEGCAYVNALMPSYYDVLRRSPEFSKLFVLNNK